MTFFSSWANLARVLGAGIVAYAGLVLVLRVSGKRTLAKLNAFDLVVTVALGSTLSALMMPGDATLVDGIAVLVLLVVAQFAIAWLMVRWPRVRRLVRSEPTLLLYRGEWQDDAMRRERITRVEVLSQVRSSGAVYLEDVEAAVLETDGTVSVLGRSNRARGSSTLVGVSGAPVEAGDALESEGSRDVRAGDPRQPRHQGEDARKPTLGSER